MIVYCATSNLHKIREFRLASGDTCQIEPLPGLALLQAPAETGHTFKENAVIKAMAYGASTDEWLFAEDSGLIVDALDGEPGVRSARYAGPRCSDDDNNQLVLTRLGTGERRSARFISTIALVNGCRMAGTFTGSVEGEILHKPTGSQGFGYDPIFYYPPFGCAFGEADPVRKFEVSHRGTALRKMLAFIVQPTQ